MADEDTTPLLPTARNPCYIPPLDYVKFLDSGAHGGGVPCIASRRQRGERQGHPEGSRAAARWLGKYSTGTTVLDLPVQ